MVSEGAGEVGGHSRPHLPCRPTRESIKECPSHIGTDENETHAPVGQAKKTTRSNGYVLRSPIPLGISSI